MTPVCCDLSDRVKMFLQNCKSGGLLSRGKNLMGDMTEVAEPSGLNYSEQMKIFKSNNSENYCIRILEYCSWC